jgi:hypothetical protein
VTVRRTTKQFWIHKKPPSDIHRSVPNTYPINPPLRPEPLSFQHLSKQNRRMNPLHILFRFICIFCIITQSLVESTEKVERTNNNEKLSTDTRSSNQSLNLLHSQENGKNSEIDPSHKSLRGPPVSKEQQTPGTVETVTDDRRLVSQAVHQLFTTPVRDWTLQQWLLMLLIFWLVSYFLRRCHCGCLQDILACFCCYSLFCDDGTLAYALC